MTDQDNPNLPHSGRRRKSKQDDLWVIKARVTTAERDQIEAMRKARKITMSEFIRVGVLGAPTEAPRDRPSTNIFDLDVRIEKLNEIALMLSSAASTLSNTTIVAPAARIDLVSSATDASSEATLPTSENRRIAGFKSAAGFVRAIQVSAVQLTRGEQIAVLATIVMLTFYIWRSLLK